MYILNLSKSNVWKNFITEIGARYITDDFNYQQRVDKHLKEFNALDLIGTPEVEFKTEEDAAFFVLRYS
jgi:hypothetical protein